MKKNNALRVAAGLVVAVLLSTCLVSGTYAKYTTSGNIDDSARVAKFGVTVTGNAGAFSDAYGATVKSADQADVVAPGTEGTFAANTIAGTPEVSVHVTNEALFELGDNWVDEDGNFYCPLEITVGNGTAIKGTTFTSADDFEKAVKEAVKATSADYAPNTSIAAACPSVSWKWAFAGNDDEKDTFLGDAAQPGEVSIGLSTTVTQID